VRERGNRLSVRTMVIGTTNEDMRAGRGSYAQYCRCCAEPLGSVALRSAVAAAARKFLSATR
jgi:hypothetical protein